MLGVFFPQHWEECFPHEFEEFLREECYYDHELDDQELDEEEFLSCYDDYCDGDESVSA